MPRSEKLRVTPGFLLLLAVLFWLDDGLGLLCWGLGACAVHELGHFAVGKALGGRLVGLELSAVGARMDLRFPAPLSYGRECAVALAGPGVNLLTGWLCAWRGAFLPAGVSFGLGIFNLLPILPLDGGRAISCALGAALDADWSERLLTVTAGVLVGLLTGAGAFLAVKYANFTLLITALWLLWLTLQKNRGGNGKKSLQF